MTVEMPTRRDAPPALGRPGRAPHRCPPRPAGWSSWPSASTSAPPVTAPPLAPPATRRRRCSTALRAAGRRRARAHRRRDPPAAHPRQVHPRPAPRPRRRPRRRPGRRRPPRRATTRSPPCWRAPSSTTSRSCRSAAVRRSPAGWPRGARGSPGVLSLDLVRMKRLLAVDHDLDDRDPRARPARPRGRGAARPAQGLTLGPLPAVVRVRHRSAASPPPAPAASPAPATAASTRWSSASPSPPRAGGSTSAPPRRTPPAPTCASCSSAPRAPSGVITSVTVRVRRLPDGEGLRGLAVAVVRRRRRRDAHARPGRAAADRAAALRRGRDRAQPGRPRRDRRVDGRRRLPDDHRLRGRAGGGGGQAGRGRPRCWRGSAARALGEQPGRDLGARALRRAVPARRAARRRRARRDAGDGDVLVATSSGCTPT